jgi:hypothetical protein
MLLLLSLPDKYKKEEKGKKLFFKSELRCPTAHFINCPAFLWPILLVEGCSSPHLPGGLKYNYQWLFDNYSALKGI